MKSKLGEQIIYRERQEKPANIIIKRDLCAFPIPVARAHGYRLDQDVETYHQQRGPNGAPDVTGGETGSQDPGGDGEQPPVNADDQRHIPYFRPEVIAVEIIAEEQAGMYPDGFVSHARHEANTHEEDKMVHLPAETDGEHQGAQEDAHETVGQDDRAPVNRIQRIDAHRIINAEQAEEPGMFREVLFHRFCNSTRK